MKKVLKNDINLKATLLSGQAFRIKEELDESFTIILDDRDPNLERIIEYSNGYKILNQPDFEMLISYIISQNNSVRNISSSIEKISKKYGKKVMFNNNEYYLFPTFNELKDADEESLKECKVGFRSKYIINALNEIKKDNNYLNDINNLSSEDAMDKLMKVKGIGMKVASCILLFGYGKLDTFPIDTWVKKFFNEENQSIIKREAQEKYGNYSGLVIQYMFHYSRNKEVL